VPARQPFAVLREPEEVVLLLPPLDGRAVDLADLLPVDLLDVVLGLRGLATDAVHAVEVAVGGVARGPQPLPHLGTRVLVARLGRADEFVVRDPDARPGRLE